MTCCAHCQGPLPTGRKRYCSDSCKREAWAEAHPTVAPGRYAVYAGEVDLVSWLETPTRRRVTFSLPLTAGTVHPFAKYPNSSRRHTRTRLRLIVEEVE